VSGADDQHFCMPTDVQVASNGFVYIADGYCNSRILIVAPDGTPLGQIAYKGKRRLSPDLYLQSNGHVLLMTDEMMVPHSLTLLEPEDLICVADRERQRILCYSAGLTNSPAGELRFRLQHPSLRRVFGLSHIGDSLIAVNGPSIDARDHDDPIGLVLDLATERMVTSFYPKSTPFVAPHAVEYDPISKSIVVVDLQSPRRPLIKFQVHTPYN
jgi:peptidylamidoglycolate lyase